MSDRVQVCSYARDDVLHNTVGSPKVVPLRGGVGHMSRCGVPRWCPFVGVWGGGRVEQNMPGDDHHDDAPPKLGVRAPNGDGGG